MASTLKLDRFALRISVGRKRACGTLNLDIAISADSKFLYSLNSSTGKIGIFAIGQDGLLSSLGDAGDFPPSSGFNGIAAY